MTMNTNQAKTLVLTASDIETIVLETGLNKIMDTLIRRLSDAFLNFDPNKTIIPIRSGFHYDLPEHGLIEWMPLHDHGKQIFVKMVGYHPNNPAKYNLPTIMSTISNYDTATGHLKAIIDGVFLTALRTGAASAVASQLFAKADSSVLGLIGCGAQSVTQLHALSRIFTFEKVLFYDIDEAAQQSFMDRVQVLGLDAKFISSDISEIVTASDIICTATSIEIGEGPLFDKLPSQQHVHINALGSDFPGKTELSLSVLNNSFVCPDFKEQAIREGECQQLEEAKIDADLFECLKNKADFQHLKTERTVFDSTGLPLEDQVVMDLFLDYAAEMGLGTEMEIEKTQVDAKNPYEFLKVGDAVAAK